MNDRIKKAVAALLCLTVLAGPARADSTLNLNLPDIGDASGGTISPQEERRLGEMFMREVRQSLTIVDDPEINEYIQALGYRLASNSENQSQDFTFFLIQDPAINAFAAPGGFIGINTGTILASESESELASVIAHEIAHVTQRHLARAFEKANKLSLPTAAAMIAAIIIGTRNSQAGQAAMAATQASSAQAQINFTRANEEEADRVGMQTLARSEFDPRSMPSFFERLQQAIRFYGPTLPEYLSTHPVTETRIADTRNRAEQYPPRQIKDSLTYHLVRAKLRVLGEPNPKRSVKHFAEALKSGQYRNAQAERYGYVLALLGNGEYDLARAQVRDLLAQDKENPAYQIALARVEMAAGHADKALAIYNDALKLYPGNNPLTVLYSDALLQTGQARKARDVLEKHIRQRNPDPGLYKLLAEAEAQAGHPAAARKALAEHYYLNGQTDAAIEQLTQALKLQDGDFYLASQIEDRLRQLKEEKVLETKR
ncbi:MAG: M48 family metalloprotease [Pseudomonadota bacterium]